MTERLFAAYKQDTHKRGVRYWLTGSADWMSDDRHAYISFQPNAVSMQVQRSHNDYDSAAYRQQDNTPKYWLTDRNNWMSDTRYSFVTFSPNYLAEKVRSSLPNSNAVHHLNIKYCEVTLSKIANTWAFYVVHEASSVEKLLAIETETRIERAIPDLQESCTAVQALLRVEPGQEPNKLRIRLLDLLGTLKDTKGAVDNWQERHRLKGINVGA